MLIDSEQTYKILCEEYPLLQKDYLRKVIDKIPTAEPKGDLISKEDVLDEIHRCLEERDYTLGSLYDNVCEMPSAERTGEWISYIDDGFVECPFCGSATNCDSTEGMEELHYCFNCGARMVSEDVD